MKNSYISTEHLITQEYLLSNGWSKTVTALGFKSDILIKEGFEICQDGYDIVENCFTIRYNDRWRKVKYKCQLIETYKEFKSQS